MFLLLAAGLLILAEWLLILWLQQVASEHTDKS